MKPVLTINELIEAARRLREMICDGANKEDIIGFLQDKNVPGDEIVYNNLADEIFDYPPKQGIFNNK